MSSYGFNRMLKGKKGMVFNVMIVIFTIVVLTYAFIRLSDKMDVEKEIGEVQMEAIATIQEGEKALIFLDFAAKMALYQAVYDLQSQGGVSESSECGTYYGFNRWNSDSGEDCFVDSKTAQDSLRDIFIGHVVARVAAYPSADFVGNVPSAAASRGGAMLGSTRVADGASGDSSPSTGAMPGGDVSGDGSVDGSDEGSDESSDGGEAPDDGSGVDAG